MRNISFYRRDKAFFIAARIEVYRVTQALIVAYHNSQLPLQHVENIFSPSSVVCLAVNMNCLSMYKYSVRHKKVVEAARKISPMATTS